MLYQHRGITRNIRLKCGQTASTPLRLLLTAMRPWPPGPAILRLRPDPAKRRCLSRQATHTWPPSPVILRLTLGPAKLHFLSLQATHTWPPSPAISRLTLGPAKLRCPLRQTTRRLPQQHEVRNWPRHLRTQRSFPLTA